MRSRAGVKAVLAAGVLTLLAGGEPCRAADEAAISPGRFTASFNPPRASVGEVAELLLRFDLPAGGQTAVAPEVGGLEELSILRREDGEGTVRFSVLVDRLTGWQTEKLTLPYRDGEGQWQVLETGPVLLEVLSNLGERPGEADLRPLRGIMPVRPPWLKHLPWAAIALGSLACAAGFLWWWRGRRARAPAHLPEDPPHLRALKEIERLEARGVFEKGGVKEYYFRFSEIMRSYLEEIRSFPAAEYTTEEIARAVVREEDQELLRLLRHADLVKFADDVPTAARKADGVAAALAYIGRTSPEGPGEGAGRAST